MKDRITQFLENEQITPTKFADTIGVQRSSISHILAGRNKPSFDFIEKMLKTYKQINAEWLILGKGNMYKQAYMPTLFPSADLVPSLETQPTANEKAPIQEDKEPEQQPVTENKTITAITNATSKTVDKIIIFYNDKTFDVYTPSSETE